MLYIRILILVLYALVQNLWNAFNAKMGTTWTLRHRYVYLVRIPVVLSAVLKTNATYVNQDHLSIAMTYQQTELTPLFLANKVAWQVTFPTRLLLAI